jgi:hypothetical protein
MRGGRTESELEELVDQLQPAAWGAQKASSNGSSYTQLLHTHAYTTY